LASVTGLAGCGGVLGSTSGDLFVDVRNEGDMPRNVQVTLTVEAEQPPSIDRTVTVESGTTARLHRANVFNDESYRVEAVTDTGRAEETDTTDCIGQRREGAEESPYYEQITVVVGAETVDLMTESC
jgi:hypothetical protein